MANLSIEMKALLREYYRYLDPRDIADVLYLQQCVCSPEHIDKTVIVYYRRKYGNKNITVDEMVNRITEAEYNFLVYYASQYNLSRLEPDELRLKIRELAKYSKRRV